VRCPRCQNLLRVQKGAGGRGISPAEHLAANAPAQPTGDNAAEFAKREVEKQVNESLRTLLSALHGEKSKLEDDDDDEKPRRVLLCLGDKRDEVAKLLAGSGYKVYVAQNPAQANERLRDGKTEILILSPDFAQEGGGAAVIQQRANSIYSSERRRLFLISLEGEGTTMNAQDAFMRNLNLIVNNNDIPQLPLILNRALGDYNDLYLNFNKASGLAAV
jgi:CheY-like chemotaxis protein